MSEGLDLGIEGLSQYTKIGSGGFATVYAAVDAGFGRWVAVKVLHSLDDDGRRRFDRERGLMGRLDEHVNVVTPYRFGYSDTGSPYLVMEYLRGGSLLDKINQVGPLSWEQAVAYIVPIAKALGRAHADGILHRDVKPANILLTSDDVPKLADFGIAAIREATATQIAFTLTHAPPETFASGQDQRDERADLYSLASTMFSLVAGQAPHETDQDDSQLAYMSRILNNPVPSIASDPRYDEFFASALAKDPDNRPADANQFIDSLHATLRPGGAAPTVQAVASATDASTVVDRSMSARPGPSTTSVYDAGQSEATRKLQPEETAIDDSIAAHSSGKQRSTMLFAVAGLVAVLAAGFFGYTTFLGDSNEADPETTNSTVGEVDLEPIEGEAIIEEAALDQELNISITPGATATVSFSLGVGEQVFVSGLTGVRAVRTVFGPDGSTVYSSTIPGNGESPEQVVAEAAGVYTFVVDPEDGTAQTGTALISR